MNQGVEQDVETIARGDKWPQVDARNLAVPGDWLDERLLRPCAQSFDFSLKPQPCLSRIRHSVLASEGRLMDKPVVILNLEGRVASRVRGKDRTRSGFLGRG